MTKTVRFEADVVTTVGVLRVHGAPGARIVFRSDVDGTQHGLDVTESDVSWIDVQDSGAVGAGAPVDDSSGGVDSGNNTGWIFALSVPHERIVVGQYGDVWFADVGAPAPASSTSDLTDDWTKLGLVSGQGVEVDQLLEVQSFTRQGRQVPARRDVLSRGIEVSFTLRELASASAFVFAAGGGSWQAQDDEFTFTPPTVGEVTERALVVEWRDGDRHYRLYVPRGQVIEAPQTTLSRLDAANMPVRFSANEPSDKSAAWYVLTDDPAIADDPNI